MAVISAVTFEYKIDFGFSAVQYYRYYLVLRWQSGGHVLTSKFGIVGIDYAI